jgi:hypothetical protein
MASRYFKAVKTIMSPMTQARNVIKSVKPKLGLKDTEAYKKKIGVKKR